MHVREYLPEISQNFGIRLYDNDRKSKHIEMNECISPWSLLLALSMTMTGSRGNTKSQIRSVLGLTEDADIEEIEKEIKILLEATRERDSVRIANAIFVRKGIEIAAEFESTLKNTYKATLKSLDFENNSPSDVAKMINDWASESTKGKINHIVDVISPSTVMCLMNAIYFKADWAIPFEQEYTKPENFSINKTDAITVDMMNQTNRFRYVLHDETKCQILELPYEDKKSSMLIFLPRYIEGLSEIEHKLNMEFLDEIYTSLRSRKVRVKLPTFKIQASYLFNSHLKNMGITDLFDQNKSQLAGMCQNTHVEITDIFQQTIIEVNEKGTIAAAVTGLVQCDGIVIEPPPVGFSADHPFLYMIFSEDYLLFMGKLVSPTASSQSEKDHNESV